MTEDTMTEQAPPTSPGDDDPASPRAAHASAAEPDTEGHRFMGRADAEEAEGEDTEAHVYVEETRNDGLRPD
jgi:hypothetical protein